MGNTARRIFDKELIGSAEPPEVDMAVAIGGDVDGLLLIFVDEEDDDLSSLLLLRDLAVREVVDGRVIPSTLEDDTQRRKTPIERNLIR